MIVGIGAICATAILFAYDLHNRKKHKQRETRPLQLCITGGPYH